MGFSWNWNCGGWCAMWRKKLGCCIYEAKFATLNSEWSPSIKKIVWTVPGFGQQLRHGRHRNSVSWKLSERFRYIPNPIWVHDMAECILLVRSNLIKKTYCDRVPSVSIVECTEESHITDNILNSFESNPQYIFWSFPLRTIIYLK